MVTDGLNPFTLLLFLAAVVGALGIGLTWLFAIIGGRVPLAQAAARIGAGALAVYAGLLFTTSLLSRERALPLGSEKHICEIDCHTAYAVLHVDTLHTIGTGAARQTAQGEFYVVTLRVRFDSATISSHRGMSPLSPGPRTVRVHDGAGTWYERSAAAEAALAAIAGPTVPLTKSVIPGETYTTTVVFDLPAGVAEPRLLVAAKAGIPDALLIGYENSLLHGKVTFRLVA